MNARSDSEAGRLQALQRLGVLDTPAEALMDSLARAAAAACDTPMAMIGLIDDSRHWIKAQVGLEGVRQIAREASLCTVVLQGGDYVEIPDARVDARVREMATVTSAPHLVFYAGVPLQTPEGHVVGTLCVLDRVPRAGLEPAQRSALQELARAVMHALLLRQAAHRTMQSSSEHLFRTLSEICPVGIFHTDAQGQCIYTNHEWQDIYGLSFEESLGSGWARGLHPDDRDGVFTEWNRVTRNGEPFDYTFRICRGGDGRVVHVRARGRAMLLPDGSIGGYVGTIVDVTEEHAYQEQLRASNEFLAQAEEIAGVGGWSVDVRTKQVRWTSQTRRIFELPPDYQPTGDEHLRFFSPQAQERIRAVADECARTGQAWDVQLPMVTAGGRAVWIRSVGRIETHNGKPVQVVGVIQDVTGTREARAALQESQERLQRALQGSRLSLWDLDVRSEMIYLSEGWSELLGGPAQETMCTAQDLLSLVPLDDLPAIQQALVAVLQGQAKHYLVRHRVRRQDGSLVWIHSEGRVAEDDEAGRPLRMVGTNRDITPTIRAEEQLRAARDEADAANRAKSQFLATMSHEIRTPLNGIIGMTKLVLDEPLTPQVRHHADLIDRSAHSLLALVNDILDVSKIEAGQMEIENVSFDLHDLLDELANLYRLRASEKSLLFRLRVAPGVPRHVKGDASRIRQVLLNLLGNALKFTEAGWIGLDVHGEPEHDGKCELEFTVADTGIGIAQEVQPRLFTRFMQADSSTSRRFGGTGLGLSIVRQLAELMGGSVQFTSAPGQGSRFTVKLPLMCSDEPLPQASSWADLPRPAASTRVLVAEDNSTNQVVAFGMLHKLGYDDVSLANDGLQAFEMARPNGFDLILMDCQMPEMDGYEATRRLRSAGCTAAIIAMTANAIKGDRERCIEAGMNDYLTKPIDLNQLAAMLARWAPPPGVERPSQMAQLPVFARDSMHSRFGGDTELEQVALASFRKATPPLLEKLKAALEAGQRPQVALLAHSAKGSGAMICAERYAALAAAIEERAPSAPLEVLGRLARELQGAYEEFIGALDAAG